ncbi:MAG: FxsA family protein [Spirochaetaceae bacterium]|nr:FxsA family protein [Spirochaetaceae bacterium]
MIKLVMFNTGFIMRLFQKDFIFKLLLLALFYSLIPLAEIVLILHVGGIFGNYLVIALTAALSLLGILIAFGEIDALIKQVKRKLKNGEYPGKEFIGIAGVLAGALLMISPGFITDAIGLCLFIPVIRNCVGKLITSKMENQLKDIYEYLKLYDAG